MFSDIKLSPDGRRFNILQIEFQNWTKISIFNFSNKLWHNLSFVLQILPRLDLSGILYRVQGKKVLQFLKWHEEEDRREEAFLSVVKEENFVLVVTG